MSSYPLFIEKKQKPKFFMPHFPVHTGNVKIYNSDRIKYILSLLGNPHKLLRNIIHVVGTNGKGSTCAYLKSLLSEESKRVNTYTSPHLYACNERIDILGKYITDDQLFYFTEKIRHICVEKQLEITIFESLTIVAMLAFSQTEADYNIIEAGMGGLFDVTNIFEEQQLACVILTSISFDHTKYLGNTLYEITLHKLGVLKPCIPLIVYPCGQEAAKAIFEEALYLNSPVYFYGRDYNISMLEIKKKEFKIEYIFQEQEHQILPLPVLTGTHQIFNLAVALTALNVLGLNFLNEVLSKGIVKAFWPGRLEKISLNKILDYLPAGSESWFDGAHNPGGAQALAIWLREQDTTFINILIISKTRGSEIKNFIEPFRDIIEYGICLRGSGEIFPEKTEILEEGFLFHKIPCHKAFSLQSALEIIAACTNERKVRLIITGSLYLARDISFL